MDKDYFSGQAVDYQKYRPGYPAALYEFLTSCVPAAPVVWDCATGNGQAALPLSAMSAHIVASDHSTAQLAEAPSAAGVSYVCARAEDMPLPNTCVGLVTVAQALHWFDFERFYAEVFRVLKPGGVVAAWTYSFLTVTPQLGTEADAAIRWFYHEVIGPWWPPERRWVDEQYQTIPFPFEPITPPELYIDVEWDLAAVMGYLSSWSAVALYRQHHHGDPLALLSERLEKSWGRPTLRRRLRWPLSLRVGRKS